MLIVSIGTSANILSGQLVGIRSILNFISKEQAAMCKIF